MGKLRLEPKEKGMDAKLFQELKSLLREGQAAGTTSKVFYDLSPDENKTTLKRNLQHVAEQEGMPVKIRSLRGEETLEFKFEQPKGSERPQQSRVGASDYREKVLGVLREADRPLKKGEILEQADLSGSTWNLRIKELLKAGLVVRTGERRDAVYSLS